jgi:hypothetical protein
MGTRGFVGYKKGNVINGWYNHYDSYPEGLGRVVVEQLHSMTPEKRIEFFGKVLKIHERDENDSFYGNHKKLFHDVKDHPWNTIEKMDLQSGGTFYKDGLFCEYAYIYNLDNHLLECYKGFGGAPDEGHEDWFETCVDGKKLYVNLIMAIELVQAYNCEGLVNAVINAYEVEK